MIKRLALLTVASFILSGCCGGTQGYIHPTIGTRDNWGRLVPASNKQKPAKARKKSPAVASRPGSSPMEEASPQEQALDGLKPYSKEWWSVRDAIDRASEANLGKKLIICRDCMPSTQDEQTGSITPK
jgi:hypothetical protein